MSSQGGLGCKKRNAASLDGDNEAGKKSKSIADTDAFNSDDELPKESAKEHLSWRTDDSFSDWKIIVSSVDEESISHTDEGDGGDVNRKTSECKKITHYNVHKNILAIGPRRSEYFVRLFENEGTFSESHDNTSHIELHGLAVKAFPEFLDYMYYKNVDCNDFDMCPGDEEEFTTDNATALYSLAKYFDVRRLCHSAKKFILHDCRKDTCATYYEHAKILQAESILEATTKYCVRFILYIAEDSRLLHVTDAKFWIDLMDERLKQGLRFSSNKMSQLIATFCKIHSVAPEMFKQLTDEKYIPELYPEAALQFLQVECKILESSGNNEDDDELSNLQKRCVKAIAHSARRKHLDGDLLQGLPSRVLREIILGMMDQREAQI